MTIQRGLLLVTVLAAFSARGFEVQPLQYFNFVDKRQASFLGPAQTRLSFGGDFIPPAGTTIVATQLVDGVEVSRAVPYLNSPGLPNQFFRSLPFTPGGDSINERLTGAWKLTWTNPDAANSGGHVWTQPICPLLCSDPNDPAISETNPFVPPFIRNIATVDTSTTPTITWTHPEYVPPAGTVAGTTLFIFDLEDSGRSIFGRRLNNATIQAFTVPTTAGLKPGHRYAFSVESTLRNIVDRGTLPGLATTGSELASARSFFNYMPTTGIPYDGPVYLPRVDNTGVFRFDFEVQRGVGYRLDPFVAIGYTYAIGAGNPPFASVKLPDLGPFNYTIALFDGTQFVPHAVVPAATRFDFAVPVDRFRVRGIPPSLALDPGNTLAFVTEVTFAGDGSFTGSMTPISVDPALDRTPPTSTATVAPAPNAAGWHRDNVTVTLSAVDGPGGSGVQTLAWSASGAQPGGASISGQITSVPITTEGATTIAFGATDFAGNAEVPRALTVMLDKTAPTIGGLPAPDCTLWPPTGKMVRVATIAADDLLSGLASVDVVAGSSEPQGDAPDVQVVGTSPGPFEVWLRAARLGGGDGRAYGITVTARAVAGNSAAASARCLVPHDQR